MPGATGPAFRGPPPPGHPVPSPHARPRWSPPRAALAGPAVPPSAPPGRGQVRPSPRGRSRRWPGAGSGREVTGQVINEEGRPPEGVADGPQVGPQSVGVRPVGHPGADEPPAVDRAPPPPRAALPVVEGADIRSSLRPAAASLSPASAGLPRRPGAGAPGPARGPTATGRPPCPGWRAGRRRRIGRTARSAAGVQTSRVRAARRNHPVQTHQQAIRRKDLPHRGMRVPAGSLTVRPVHSPGILDGWAGQRRW